MNTQELAELEELSTISSTGQRMPPPINGEDQPPIEYYDQHPALIPEYKNPKQSSRPLPPVFSLEELSTTPIPQPDELIQGVLHKGSKMVIGGASKAHKSWNLIDLSLSVVTGTPYLSLATSPGKVLYVNLEIQDFFFRQRLNAVIGAKGIRPEPNQFFYWGLRGHCVDFDQLKDQFIQRLVSQNFSLIVIDPCYKVMGRRDEKDASDMASLFNGFETLSVDTGAAVAFGSHYAKGNASAKDAIDRISGSGVFARDPDSMLMFTDHEEDDCYTVEPILRNFPPLARFVVEWNYPRFTRVNDLDPTKLKAPKGGAPQKCSDHDLLDLLKSKPLFQHEWRDLACQSFQIHPVTFNRRSKKLLKNHKVSESGNGVFSLR